MNVNRHDVFFFTLILLAEFLFGLNAYLAVTVKESVGPLGLIFSLFFFFTACGIVLGMRIHHVVDTSGAEKSE